MDTRTLELMEFHKVRELLAGQAASALGKDLARQIEPGIELEPLQAELKLVSEMVDALGEGLTPPFAGLADVRLLVRRAAIGAMLTADQLLEVAGTLSCTGHMYRFRMRLDPRFARLIQLMNPIEDLGPVAKAIQGCIDGRGHVLDLASPELSRLRRQLADLDERVQQQIRKMLRDPELRKALRYGNATVSGDHFVLPVAVNYRHMVPGVVHRTSSSGETVYIEPAAVAGISAERTLLKNEEDREIRRILRKLTGEVGKVARPLNYAIDAMATLDLITAKARFSRDFNMSEPDLNTENRLWLRVARHPLLEHLFRREKDDTEKSDAETRRGGDTETGAVTEKSDAETRRGGDTETGAAARSVPASPRLRVSAVPIEDVKAVTRKVVPIDVRLGQPYRLMIITGPNTGGKTVTLKTAGLLCLMAQSGLHIPAAAGSQVPILHHILADIGDEQSLEQSLSTFSSHISRIRTILEQADARSLILLDELGAGTDPTEGSALGRAILDTLAEKGCLAMVTTHLGDLKTYAFTNEHAENAAVEFDVETLRPTYRLLIGQFGMSNALKIARRLKLPRPLLKRAQRYLRRKQKRTPELTRLQEIREQAEKAREQALQAQHEANVEKEAYEQKLADMARAAEEAERLRAFRAKLQPNDPVRVTRFDKPGRLVRIDTKKGLALVAVGLGQWEVPLDEIFPCAGGPP
ncbi:MAG: endonuclease MutS2 [Gemmataceae bacterium]